MENDLQIAKAAIKMFCYCYWLEISKIVGQTIEWFIACLVNNTEHKAL